MSPSPQPDFALATFGALTPADLASFIVCLLASALLGWMLYDRRARGRG